MLLFGSIVTILLFYLNPLYFIDPPSKPTSQTLYGQISSIPRYDGNKVSLELRTTEKQTYQVNYYAKTKENLDNLSMLKLGMKCSLEGIYKDPPERRNFYSFDYRSYLATQNVFYQFSPKSFSITDCQEGRLTPITLLKRYRQAGIQYIKDHYPKESQGIVIALLFGDRNEIDGNVLQAYQSLGIIHLLAVSGLHVGLVSGLLYILFIRVGITKERSSDLLLIFLPIYAIVAGGAASVIRASAMSMIVLISLKMRAKLNPLYGISAVCIMILLLNPSYIFHLGFQLSFLVSYTLLISSTTILQRYFSWFSQLLVVTVIAQLVSFPLIIYHFYEISIWSIPLNLIYIPFITIFTLPFAFLTFFCTFIFPQPLSEIILMSYNFVIIFAHKALEKIIALPLSTFIFGKPPLFFIPMYYITIGYFFYSWERKGSLFDLFKSSSLIMIVLLLHWNIGFFNWNGEVTMLDVGQGDSIFIELPRRKAVYLIDTGGLVQISKKPDFMQRDREYEVGKDVLIPFLKAKGVRNIDKLILSHGHYDHIGGAEALIGVISVDQLLYGSSELEEGFEKQLLESFKATGTKVLTVNQGDRWSVGDHEFVILSSISNDPNLNDRSIVLFTKLGGLTWLFTGDLESDGEKRLLSSYPNLQTDVLKVGHHGSQTSTTEKFLNQINPKVALISLGKNNVYGHPHKEVIDRLRTYNVKVYRTDQHGAIRFVFRNEEGWFETIVLEK